MAMQRLQQPTKDINTATKTMTKKRVTFGSMPKYDRAGVGKRCHNRTKYLAVRLSSSPTGAVRAARRVLKSAHRQLGTWDELEAFLCNLASGWNHKKNNNNNNNNNSTSTSTSKVPAASPHQQKERKVYIPYEWFERWDGATVGLRLAHELSKCWDYYLFCVFVQTMRLLVDEHIRSVLNNQAGETSDNVCVGGIDSDTDSDNSSCDSGDEDEQQQLPQQQQQMPQPQQQQSQPMEEDNKDDSLFGNQVWGDVCTMLDKTAS